MASRNITQEIAERELLLDKINDDLAPLLQRDAEDLTPEQMDRIERQVEKAERVRDELTVLKAEKRTQIDAIREAAKDPKRVQGPEPSFQYMKRGKAWEDPIRHHGGLHRDEIRSRALYALYALDSEDTRAADSDKERIEKLVRSDAGAFDAEFVVATSNPDYRTAFLKMLRDPRFGHLAFSPEEQRAFSEAQQSEVRTAMSTTAGNGGYLIPFALDPTIQLTNAGTENPWRSICRTTTLNNSNVWHGVSSAGVSAEWVAETTEATDASPTFSQPTITPQRADVYVQASYEVTQDSDIGAPPVVMTHPMGVGGFVWSSIIEIVSAHRHAYALDTIGDVGRSELADPGKYPKTGRDYSDWLDDVFTALDLRAADMIGGSMGGWIAMNHAIFAPERVGRLVLLGPMGLAPWRSTLAVLGPFMSQRLRPTEAKLDAIITRSLGEGARVNREFRPWMQIMGYTKPRVGQPFHIPSRRLRRIAAPTLVFLGGRDGLVGPPGAAAKRAQRDISGCEIQVLADAGHVMSIDEPDFVGTRTIEFLR